MLVASGLAVALGAETARAIALPDPFPSREVQQAAIASDGAQLVVFLRAHLDDPVLPGKDDPGLLVRWGGASWSAPEPITNECHAPDVAVAGGRAAMTWIDDEIRPRAACDPACISELLSLDSALGLRATFVGDVPVASYTQVSAGNDRLYVTHVEWSPQGGPQELAGGTHCFDDPYFHCPSLRSPALVADGSGWIAAYVAFALNGACVGVRRSGSLPEACLLQWLGASPHDVEIVLVDGEPFVLWAELVTTIRGTADRAIAARYDAAAGWVLADAPAGFEAGAGLAWERIRAVSDGASVTALYERSDGALFARRWDATHGFRRAPALAAAGAGSSDLTLHAGEAMAAYVREGRVFVETVPEPAPAWLALGAAFAIATLRRRAIG